MPLGAAPRHRAAGGIGLLLAAGLGLNTSLPGFGAAANAGGDALANIWRRGAAAGAAALAATCAPAGTPAVVGAPGATTTRTTTTRATTRGTITSDNAAVLAFSPNASSPRQVKAVTTPIGSNSTQYFFTNSLQGAGAVGSSAGVATRQFLFSTFNGVPSAVAVVATTFERGIARRTWRDCALPCAGFSMARTANGQGMRLTPDNSRLQPNVRLCTVANPPTAAVVLQRSVTAEIAGGDVLPSQLPHASDGSLTLDGAAVPVRYSCLDGPDLRRAQPAPGPRSRLNTAALASTASAVGRPAGVLRSTGEAGFKPLSSTTSGASEPLIDSFRGTTPAGVQCQRQRCAQRRW